MSDPMKDRSDNDDQYREKIVHYFLQINPYISWERIGAQLTFEREIEALQEVKKYIKSDKGMCLEMVKVIYHRRGMAQNMFIHLQNSCHVAGSEILSILRPNQSSKPPPVSDELFCKLL
jgi:hypothetical protein